MLEVTPVPAFRDNYIWLIHGLDRTRVAVVDPGDASVVIETLAAARLRPVAVLITHHHADHTGGAATLRDRFGIPVHGPAREARDVVTHPLADHETLRLEALDRHFEILEIPGHTLGHIAFHGHGAVFCGDTLFSAGCGRLFEGSAEQMSASLERLAQLPGETRIFCGHEYTAANLDFAATVEPDNREISAWRREVTDLRARNKPSLPSRMDRERAVNPFLRTSESDVRLAAEQWSGTALNDKVRVFAALRRWKDNF